MKFEEYLDKTKEVGDVSQVIHGIAYVAGLPGVHLGELVLFEAGGRGRTMGLREDIVEVLMLTETLPRVGERAARMGEILVVGVGDNLLGKTLNAVGESMDGESIENVEKRSIDEVPLGIFKREMVTEPLETGVAVVDLIVPLGKGQRQLVVGERKTGKTDFLMRSILTQARQGTLCVYAAIGKKTADVKVAVKYFEDHGIKDRVVTVVSTAGSPAGMIFLTPYTATTIAEYFKDKGQDVLVVYDDLVTHAKYHREISLTARRFPGRSSYPGDVFYLHAKLMERCGKYKSGSITALAVAETVGSDLSGYIQTNLMSMTDGHIFYDKELANLGRRPAINPFLSVTRVGQQAQTKVVKELSRQLSAFLVDYEKMKEFLHFGAELSEQAKQKLSLGARILTLLEQEGTHGRRLNVGVLLMSCLWAGFWKELEQPKLAEVMEQVNVNYEKSEEYRKWLDGVVVAEKSFDDLVEKLKEAGESVVGVKSSKNVS